MELMDSQSSVITVTKHSRAVAPAPAIAQVQGSLCLLFCQLWAHLLQVLDLRHHNQLQHIALEESKALQITRRGHKRERIELAEHCDKQH